jgi:hypothetical protein
MTELKSKWNGFACSKFFRAAAAFAGLWFAAPDLAVADDRAGEATRPTSTSIRTNLAGVAASAFEPAQEGVVHLSTFGSKPAVAVLNVPPPGSLSPVAPAEDHIPEPGAIGFGLAVAALILGNFAKALMRCWKITSSTPSREL